MFSPKEIFPYTPMKEQTEDNDDDEFDTLSLSDLPIYSHTSSDFSKSNSSSIYDQPNNESFEFLTMDFRPQTHPDIVFCGKPIPCRETQTYQDDRYTMKSSHKRCMRYLFRRTKTKQVTENHANDSGKFTNYTTSKYKWSFLVFGLQKFSLPTKVELADMKCRQSKRSAAKSVEMLERNSSIDSSKSNSKLDKSLSYLLRSLSCNSKHSISVLD